MIHHIRKTDWVLPFSACLKKKSNKPSAAYLHLQKENYSTQNASWNKLALRSRGQWIQRNSQTFIHGISQWQLYEVLPKLSISVLTTSTTHFSVGLLPDCSCAVQWRSLGRVRLGLTAPSLNQILLLTSSSFSLIHKITPWCRNTDIPSSPTAKVRPFSLPPTLCLSCPRLSSQSWAIPCLHFCLWWLHVWYGASRASGLAKGLSHTDRSCRDLDKPTAMPRSGSGNQQGKEVRWKEITKD